LVGNRKEEMENLDTQDAEFVQLLLKEKSNLELVNIVTLLGEELAKSIAERKTLTEVLIVLNGKLESLQKKYSELLVEYEQIV